MSAPTLSSFWDALENGVKTSLASKLETMKFDLEPGSGGRAWSAVHRRSECGHDVRTVTATTPDALLEACRAHFVEDAHWREALASDSEEGIG